MNQQIELILRDNLSEIIKKDRCDFLTFTIFGIALTPIFALLAALMIYAVIRYVDLIFFDHELYKYSLQTGLNGFLAFLFLIVIFGQRPPYLTHQHYNKYLGVALSVFIVLLLLCYTTSLINNSPIAFWLIYIILGVSILTILGQIHVPKESYFLGVFHGLIDYPLSIRDDVDRARYGLSVTAALPLMIISCYGEIFSGSWLWKSPKAHDIATAAKILLHLSEDKGKVDNIPHIEYPLTILWRSKLISLGKNGIEVSFKGKELLSSINREH